jgi:hypothetical protein
VRQPSRVTWLVIGGVAALLVVAIADELRSSESESARSVATAQTENEASPTTTAATTEASVSAGQEIEQAGNEWARLFAGDRHMPAPGTCQYMTQPGCERINCERVGGRPIENCKRPSLKFRRSFADATVTAIAIKGRRAAARFSNGVMVRMEIGGAGEWWIHRIGAGRQFFE